jgi:hypothetical protein
VCRQDWREQRHEPLLFGTQKSRLKISRLKNLNKGMTEISDSLDGLRLDGESEAEGGLH